MTGTITQIWFRTKVFTLPPLFFDLPCFRPDPLARGSGRELSFTVALKGNPVLIGGRSLGGGVPLQDNHQEDIEMTGFGYLNAVFHQRLDISPSARHVLIQLLGHRNGKTGLCFPTIFTLSHLTGYSINTVQAGLAELRHKHLIDVETQHRKPNKYTFNIPSLPKLDSSHCHQRRSIREQKRQIKRAMAAIQPLKEPLIQN